MKIAAVVGLGNIAKRHRKNLKVLFPDIKVYAFSASGRIPTEKVEDADEVLANFDELIEKNIELAIIASPATCHKLHAEIFTKIGIPIFIEKPITASNEDAFSLLNLFNARKTKVGVGYCLRYLPSAQIVKKMIEAQEIGKIINAQIEIGQYLPDWRPDVDYRNSVSANKELGGGALLELSHELDYVQWLFGEINIEHAVLRTSNILDINVEDVVDIFASTMFGSIVSIHLDFIQKKAHRTCSIIGSEGRIDWDLIENIVTVSDKQNVKVAYDGKSWDKNQMYILMIQDFIRYIKNQKNNVITAFEATQTVKLIDSIKKQFEIRKG